MAVLDVVKAEIEKMQNSIKREATTENRLATLKLAMEKLAENISGSVPLPDETNYSSYEEWQADIEGDIKSTQNSLATLQEYKDLIVALSAYVDGNPGV